MSVSQNIKDQLDPNTSNIDPLEQALFEDADEDIDAGDLDEQDAASPPEEGSEPLRLNAVHRYPTYADIAAGLQDGALVSQLTAISNSPAEEEAYAGVITRLKAQVMSSVPYPNEVQYLLVLGPYITWALQDSEDYMSMKHVDRNMQPGIGQMTVAGAHVITLNAGTHPKAMSLVAISMIPSLDNATGNVVERLQVVAWKTTRVAFTVSF